MDIYTLYTYVVSMGNSSTLALMIVWFVTNAYAYMYIYTYTYMFVTNVYAWVYAFHTIVLLLYVYTPGSWQMYMRTCMHTYIIERESMGNGSRSDEFLIRHEHVFIYIYKYLYMYIQRVDGQRQYTRYFSGRSRFVNVYI